MNNKKYSKIIVFALSLALLIGAAVGIVANAENSESAPEILAKNIEYGDTLKFMVAINPESVGGEGKTVTFSVYEGDPDNNGKMLGKSATAVYEDTSETNLEVDFAYIGTATYGISPLAYGENYYLVVECDGAKTVTQYSAIEYFLERLYGDDIINATEEAALLQKEIYENAIAYGASVQKYAAYEGKFTGTNVADYNYVKVNGGTINGASTAIVADGDVTVALTEAVPSGKEHTGWSITVGDETAKVTGNTVTITDSCTIAPIFEANGSVETVSEGETFDNQPEANSDGYYAVNKVIARGKKGTETDTAIFNVVADPKDSGNYVAQLGKTAYGVDNSKSATYLVSYTSRKTAPSLIVFETKILINSIDATGSESDLTILQVGMSKGATTSHLLNLKQDVDGGEYFYFSYGKEADGSTIAESNEANRVAFGEWAAVRIEVENTGELETTVTRLYVNNIFAGEYTGGGSKSTNDMDSGAICYLAGFNPTVYIDNSSIKETSLAQ